MAYAHLSLLTLDTLFSLIKRLTGPMNIVTVSVLVILNVPIINLWMSESDVHCPWWAIDSSHTGEDLHVILVALVQTGDVQRPHSMTVH